MKSDLRQDREDRIEAATYELLAEKGYASASMLSIAKRAKCSNETMYNWYGDKVGLIRALVTRNAATARSVLEQALEGGGSALETLDRFGPVLMDVLLGDKAVALNRAAAADPSGELGGELSASGRGVIAPMLGDLLTRAAKAGEIPATDIPAAVDLYLGVLIGDLQIRRVIGALPPPAPSEVQRRNTMAIRALITLTA